MDNDLELMKKKESINEVLKLRRGIREHRDSTGHDFQE